ncbi:uncharacterized protein NEMAJ01_1569 [Nematocida major]|uniref:uncharacterized protein n=1 Tax=Nematocida major TaxID=1912982 RepID=UPI0020075954|nr:uncharacterized protein NEMAJ01_1569 [Nematocida major]KAH9386673.1 hypothetical protein NEMAJ01_1569 [Nematocida major]
MKEREAQELILAYIDPLKKKTAELLAQKLDGSVEEVDAFLHLLKSNDLKIREMAALFLKHSLSISARAASSNNYPSILATLYAEISPSPSRVDNLMYESVGILCGLVGIDDVFHIVSIDSVSEGPAPTAQTDKALKTLCRYTDKYRAKEKSNELYAEINYLITRTKDTLYALVQHIISSPGTEISAGLQLSIYTIISTILAHDLPDYFEENIMHYTAGLYAPVGEVPQNTVRSIILLRIKLSAVLVSRYSDAYEKFSVFINSLTALYSETEKLDEGVQVEFMHYLCTLLGNHCILSQAVPLHAQDGLSNNIVQMLLHKIEVDDSEGDLEYMQALLQGDPTLIRDIAASIMKELIERNPSLFSALSAHRAHNNVLFLVLHLIRNKHRIQGDLCMEWVRYAIGAVHSGEDSIKISLSCALLITCLDMNVHSSEILAAAPAILRALIAQCTPEAPKYILFLSSELMHALCAYSRISVEERASEGTLKYLMSVFQESPNEYIGKGIFHLLRMAHARSAAFSSTASEMLTKHVETLGNTKMAKTLWDIMSLDALYGGVEAAEKLIVDCIGSNTYEYYTYAVQLLSLINLSARREYCINLSASILNNPSLWSDQHILPSLAYLGVSLVRCGAFDVNSLLKHILGSDAALRIASRYFDAESVLTVYNSAGAVPQFLLRYIQILMNSEYTSELHGMVSAFVSKPTVPDEDTQEGIRVLEEYLERHAHQAAEVRHVLEKLKRRRYRKKDDPWSISLLDEVFALK